jgi:antitoxin component YwqK of YwqJK toxin-antitoxin module
MLTYKEQRYPNGNLQYQVYYLDKEMSIYHNPEGPAITMYYENGQKESIAYYLNGKVHNINGPADIWYDENGNKLFQVYWLNGIVLMNIHSDEELKQYIKLNNLS